MVSAYVNTCSQLLSQPASYFFQEHVVNAHISLPGDLDS